MHSIGELARITGLSVRTIRFYSDSGYRVGLWPRRLDARRAELAGRLAAFSDERVERYWQLLRVINGWPSVPSTMGDWRWTIPALRVRRITGPEREWL